MPKTREDRPDIDIGPSGTAPAGGSPHTCCPTCRTVFQIATELVDSANTGVRCGECYEIFDAAANLIGDGPTGYGSIDAVPIDAVPIDNGAAGHREASDRIVSTVPPAALDDYDLFSEDAELPEVAYLDQTRDTPDFDFDSVATDDDENFSDTLFAADMTVDVGRRVPVLDADDPRFGRLDPSGDAGRRPAPLAAPMVELPAPAPLVDPDASSRVDLDFTYRDPAPDPVDELRTPDATGPATAVDSGIDSVDLALDGPPPFEPRAGRSRSWRLPVVIASTVLLVLAGLHGYRQRDALHEDPFTRPIYEAVCRISGCEVPLRSALDRIDLLERQMFSHPNLPGALVIDVAFRNAADFAQALPALSVRLSDAGGRLVARRTFQPDEYLAERDEPFIIAPQARLRVSLDVDDPGRGASSFVIDFEPARDVATGR